MEEVLILPNFIFKWASPCLPWWASFLGFYVYKNWFKKGSLFLQTIACSNFTILLCQALFLHTYVFLSVNGFAGKLSFWKKSLSFEKKILSFWKIIWVFENYLSFWKISLSFGKKTLDFFFISLNYLERLLIFNDEDESLY